MTYFLGACTQTISSNYHDHSSNKKRLYIVVAGDVVSEFVC